jgi:hypothetical protein
MKGRTEPRNYRMVQYYRPNVKQDTINEVRLARDDKELSDVISEMDDAVHHCKDQECRENYKITLSRAIIKYGYRAIDEAYR